MWQSFTIPATATRQLLQSMWRTRSEVPGVEASLYKAEDLSNPDKGPWDQLAAADAIIFGAPTYMGSASAQFKQFADASSKVSLG